MKHQLTIAVRKQHMTTKITCFQLSFLSIIQRPVHFQVLLKVSFPSIVVSQFESLSIDRNLLHGLPKFDSSLLTSSCALPLYLLSPIPAWCHIITAHIRIYSFSILTVSLTACSSWSEQRFQAHNAIDHCNNRLIS